MSDAPNDDPIERLIEEAGLGSLPASAKVALIDQLSAEIEGEIGERLMSHMSEDQIEKYSTLMSDDRDYLVAWLRDNDPEFSDVIVNEPIQDLRDRAQQLFMTLNVSGFRRVVRIVLNRRRIQLTEQAPEILGAIGDTPSE